MALPITKTDVLAYLEAIRVEIEAERKSEAASAMNDGKRICALWLEAGRNVYYELVQGVDAAATFITLYGPASVGEEAPE